MNIVKINTQAELDALPDSYEEFTLVQIHGGTRYDRIVVRKNIKNCSIEGRENCSIEGRGNCSIVGWENCSIEGRENCSIEGRENCSIVGWGNCSIEGWGNCSIVGWGNCSIEGRENCSIVGWGNVAVHVHSTGVSLELFAFAAAWLIAKAKKLTRHGKNTTVITPKTEIGTEGWLEANAVAPEAGHVILFKRVSDDFKTQEKTANETLWIVGSTVEHPAWSPKGQECGPGKYHACSRPYFCDEFRKNKGDRYVSIKIAVADLHAWVEPSYPHKIAFRKGEVLGEVTKFGKPIAK